MSRKTNGACDVKYTHYTISYRSFKNFDENKFIDELKSTPWDILMYLMMLITLSKPGHACFVTLLISTFLCDNIVSSANSNSNGSLQISLMHLKHETDSNP